jgi:hypothetical protein
MSLKAITHPVEPTRFAFDYRQSSFLSDQAESEMAEIYQDPSTTGEYLRAMSALVEAQLEKSVKQCMENGKRLLIYEDGAYVMPIIYDMYRDSTHRLHPLVKRAVDERTIVGAVEVTVAGERRDRAAIEANQGQALLPVLSTARDDIKAIFEAKGVAEAILDSASTALGNLGLPTFETRRIAVVGGNGAIGTRLVEKISQAHNSTANVFVVDIVADAFAGVISDEDFPHAAVKVGYQKVERYLVRQDCLPVVLDVPFGHRQPKIRVAPVRAAIRDFFADAHKCERYDELAIANSFPLPDPSLAEIVEDVCRKHGYQKAEVQELEDGGGIALILVKDNSRKTITLLRPHHVLTFKRVSRLIENLVDTIIGITGLPVFEAKDLDAFFARDNAADDEDDLVLVSGSSKDYEFKKAIVFLDKLLAIQFNTPGDATERLAWYAEFYDQEMSFLIDDDFHAIRHLLSEPVTDTSIEAFARDFPKLSAAIGFDKKDPERSIEALVRFISEKIRGNLSIRKDVLADLGSVYSFVVNGKRKKLVLLANGFVVNFFAKYEKGVKTEYIDPIVTMQLLGLVRLALAEEPIEPGVYRMAEQLDRHSMRTFWKALDERCRPLDFE